MLYRYIVTNWWRSYVFMRAYSALCIINPWLNGKDMFSTFTGRSTRGVWIIGRKGFRNEFHYNLVFGIVGLFVC